MNKKTITIVGKVFHSTNETMGRFGRLGDEVVADYGIDKIDQGDNAPMNCKLLLIGWPSTDLTILLAKPNKPC